MGTRDGSIMATIITTHIPINVVPAASQVCPAILIHAMDMVQPPGIGIPSDIDQQVPIVIPALARNSNALLPRNVRSFSRLARRSTAAAPQSTTGPPSSRPITPALALLGCTDLLEQLQHAHLDPVFCDLSLVNPV